MSTCCASHRRVSLSFRRLLVAGSIAIVAVAMLSVGPRPVSADTFQFNANPTTDWNTAANWLDLTTPANNGTLPGAADTADVNNNQTSVLAATPANSYTNVYIGPENQSMTPTLITGSGTLNHTGGTLTVTNLFRVGESADGANTGTYNMSGSADLEAPADVVRIGENGTGIVTAIGNSIMNIHGLSIADNGTGSMTIGGAGSNVQVNVATDTFIGNNAGSTGTLRIHDGATFTQTAGDVHLGPNGNGKIIQDGGLFQSETSGNWVNIGMGGNGTGTGEYDLSGDAIAVMGTAGARLVVGGNGQNGHGILSLSGNSSLTSNREMNIGGSTGSTGVVNQADNSSLTANGAGIWMAHNANGGGAFGGTATYNISGGTLTATQIRMATGRAGTAHFNQTGGSVSTTSDWLRIGDTSGYEATDTQGFHPTVADYTISGGSLQVHDTLMIAGEGHNIQGTMNISGTATVNADNRIALGQNGQAAGNTGNTAIVNQTGGTVTSGELRDGWDRGNTATYNLSAGNLTISGGTHIGGGGGGGPNVGAHGTFNLSGTGTLTAGNDILLGDGGFGTLTQTGGTLNQTGGWTRMGFGGAPGAQGTLNLSGGTSNFGWIRAGEGGSGLSVVNIMPGANAVSVGRLMAGTGSDGTYNQTGGIVTVNQDTSIGEGGTGTYNLSGGTLIDGSGGTAATNSGGMQLGWSHGGTGIINQTGGTNTVLQAGVQFGGRGSPNLTGVPGDQPAGDAGDPHGGTGIYTLSSGLLQSGAIFTLDPSNTASGTFNFNGGQLQATANDGVSVRLGHDPVANVDVFGPLPAYLYATPGATFAANVQAGGAKVDVNGHTITFAVGLQHDPAAPTPDGGLTLSDSTVAGGGTLTLTGAGTFNGVTSVTPNATAGPTLRVGNSLALQQSTVNPSFAGAVVFTPGLGSATFGQLTGSANLPLQDTGAAAISLSVGNNNTSSVYNGVLSGPGSLTKVGTGTLTFNTTQTYTGTTRVNGGTLLFDPSGLSNSSSVTVGGAAAAPGSMPTLAGPATIANGVTVNGAGGTGDAGHLAPHLSGLTGTMNVGSLTLNGGSILDLNVGAAGSPGTSDLIASAGALTLPGAGTGNVTVNLTDISGGSFGTGTYKIISESSTTNFTATSFSVGVGIPGFQIKFSNGIGPTLGLEIDMNVSPAPTWKAVAQDQNWANGNNWVGGLIPGATSGTTNTDLAAFTTNTNIPNPLPDANRNLQNITFDQAAASAYVIGSTGGNALLLTSGGTIQTTSLITKTETVNAPLVLEGASGSYTFSSNAPAAANVLIIGGAVSGGAAGNTTLTLSGTNTGLNAVNGVISNGAATTLGITKTGGGIWVLGGNNTFTGGVDIEAGALAVGNAGALNATTPNAVTFGPASTGALALNGNTVTISGLNTTSTNAAVADGNAAAGTLRVNSASPSSFAGTLVDGPFGGQLNLAVIGGSLTLSGSDTFSGTTDVTGTGSLTVANTNALQNSTLHMTVPNSVLFNAGIGNVTIGGLSGNGNLALQDTLAAPITASIGNNGGSTTYSGSLTGPGALTKIGAGTLTLTGANTYTGITTVSNGTLRIGDGATNGSIASQVIINNAAVVFNNPNPQSYGGTILGTGTLTKSPAGGALTLTGNSSYSGGTTVGAGATVNVGPSPFAASPLGTGSVTLNGSTLNLNGALNSGLRANLYDNPPAPADGNGNDPDYLTLTAMNAHFAGLLPTVTVLTSAGAKTNLDYTNNNGSRAPMFGGLGATQANYGFPPIGSAPPPGLDNFEANFNGLINIKVAGNYTFSTTSDDGSVVFLDGVDAPLVNNNFYQGMTTRSGSVFLTAGTHAIALGFYEGGGGLGWGTTYSGPDTGGATVEIPNAVLTPDANPLTMGTTQTYTNNLVVTANSTVSVNGSLTASLGGLTMSAATLNVTSGDATTNPYSLTFNGATTLNGNATFNVANSAGGGPGTLRIGSANEGPGGPFSITKTGPGTLVLTAPGTYAGGTTIQAAGGTVQANGPGTLGTGAVTLNNGTTLRLVANPNPVPTITGFNGGVGWTVNNNSDAQPGGPGPNDAPFINGPNALRLTNSNNGISRSVIRNTPVGFANGFVATFTYSMTGGGGNPADGMAIFLENASDPTHAMGGGGGFLGYAGNGPAGTVPNTPSVAYLINSYNGHPIGTALDTNGTDPANSYQAVDPVSYIGNGTTGHPTNFKIVYDPTSQTITESLFDTVTNASFTRTTSTGGDLSTLLGGTTAYLGLSGATGGLNMTQDITNFTYSPNLDTNYSNAVNLTGGASATMDLSTVGPSTINMGPLTVGAGVGTTLNFTATGAPANSNYGFGFTSATFNGNLAINMATNGSGTGTMSVNGPSTFANNVTVTMNSGRLRFANTGGPSTVGTGVTVSVASTASLELAGTTSNLSNSASPADRVHIANASSAAAGGGGGLIVSGTNQQVGAITGAGDTGVNAGASLTADHIIQTTLAIGGSDATHTGLVTINSSSATGAPTGGGLAVAGSLDPGTPFGSGSGSSSGLAASASSSDSLGGSAAGGVGGSAPVPEPSSLVLVLLAGLACLAPVIRRRKRA